MNENYMIVIIVLCVVFLLLILIVAYIAYKMGKSHGISQSIAVSKENELLLKQITDGKDDANRQVELAKEEMEEKINQTKNEANKQIMIIKEETEKRIADSKIEADERVKQARIDAMKQIEINKSETQNQISQIKSEADKRIEQTRNDAIKQIEMNKSESQKQISQIKLEAENKINSIKEEMSIKVEETKNEANQRISENKKESDERVEKTKNEATKMIENYKNEFQNQISQIRSESAKQINETKQEASSQIEAIKAETNKTIERIKGEAEKEVAETKQEAQENINRLKEENLEFQKSLEHRYEEQHRLQIEQHANQIKVLQEQQTSQLNAFREQLENSTRSLLEKRQDEFQKVNSKKMDEILNPFKEKLTEMKKAFEDNKESNNRNSVFFDTTIKNLMNHSLQLAKDTEQLTEALRNKGKVQGDWGEQLLTHILENSGLRQGEEFEIQQSLYDEDRKWYRPDVIVHCSDGRNVIIDSKVSLTAFYDYVNATTEQERLNAETENLKSIKKHIKELVDKNYSKLVPNALPTVLMFVPNEGSYILALQKEPNLGNDAFRKGILIINPTNLMLALSLIYELWKIEHREDNNRKIVDAATKMYEKFCNFAESFEKIGMQIQKAQENYDNAKKQLNEGKNNLIKQVDSLQNLGISTKKQIPENIKC